MKCTLFTFSQVLTSIEMNKRISSSKRMIATSLICCSCSDLGTLKNMYMDSHTQEPAFIPAFNILNSYCKYVIYKKVEVNWVFLKKKKFKVQGHINHHICTNTSSASVKAQRNTTLFSLYS
eukprot:GHVL01038171.1.p1 GENE.GHVL01038171.1~~GHVL01038171.1.p1  ORF type:complete len:121 (+),score=9.29 GHVL01038171.1:63-425(+)